MARCRVPFKFIVVLASINGMVVLTYLNFFENQSLDTKYSELSAYSVKKLDLPWINQYVLNGSINSAAAKFRFKSVVFAHIQKTGGTSITEYFTDLKKSKLKFQRPEPHHADMHHTFKKVFDGNVELYHSPELLKFTVVRNPWARLVSWWAMIHSDLLRHGTKSKSGNPWFKYIRHCCPNECVNFTHFIDRCQESVTKNYFALRSIKKDQLSFLVDPNDGRWLVDFVGRYETLMQDIEFVVTTLLHREFVKADFPWITYKSNHTHYSTYYTDRTARLVGEWYRRDIETFNYTFERVAE